MCRCTAGSRLWGATKCCINQVKNQYLYILLYYCVIVASHPTQFAADNKHKQYQKNKKNAIKQTNCIPSVYGTGTMPQGKSYKGPPQRPSGEPSPGAQWKPMSGCQRGHMYKQKHNSLCSLCLLLKELGVVHALKNTQNDLEVSLVFRKKKSSDHGAWTSAPGWSQCGHVLKL